MRLCLASYCCSTSLINSIITEHECKTLFNMTSNCLFIRDFEVKQDFFLPLVNMTLFRKSLHNVTGTNYIVCISNPQMNYLNSMHDFITLSDVTSYDKSVTRLP